MPASDALGTAGFTGGVSDTVGTAGFTVTEEAAAPSTGVAVSSDRMADMAFCRGTVPYGVGRLPIPDGTID